MPGSENFRAALFTDGTTSLFFQYPNEDITPLLDRISKTSAGGRRKSQTGGQRLRIVSGFETNQAGFDSLMTLFTNSANSYFYTPADYADKYTSAIEIDIRKVKKDFDSIDGTYNIEVEMDSVEYV